jgi:DNA-binding transcriptional regulator YiaG
MDLSRKLKFVRESLKLSQSQAAAEWGVTKRSIEAWEQGYRSPRGLALAQLNQILDKALQEGRGATPKASKGRRRTG